MLLFSGGYGAVLFSILLCYKQKCMTENTVCNSFASAQVHSRLIAVPLFVYSLMRIYTPGILFSYILASQFPVNHFLTEHAEGDHLLNKLQ
jgi:hypothetical protein